MKTKTNTKLKIQTRRSGLLGLALLCFSSSAAATPHARTFAAEPPAIVASAQGAFDSEHVHDLLAARRSLNLERLFAYANAGEFPQNTVSPGPLNVFVDDSGHICAAANLIDKDGFPELVQDTARRNNYIVLSSVRKGPLMDWMLTSGFTQEEIALIQEPYMPIEDGFANIDDPGIPEPVFVAKPVPVEDERKRVQDVLLGVHKLLTANTIKSLGIAVARLDGKSKAVERLERQLRSLETSLAAAGLP